MADAATRLARSQEISSKVNYVFQKRVSIAQETFRERLRTASQKYLAELQSRPMAPWNIWSDWWSYSVDFAQRSVILMDTLRQRGNNYLDHVAQGQPPLLHFDYETVLDARNFERPVNYALVRIVPPEGVTVNPRRRPYMIVDPRAGHGPGIDHIDADV